MNLEPLHEKAIDLFVMGKKQYQVAAELNVNPRTVRRWADEEKFVAELNKQHSLARKLEQDEAAEAARELSELRKLARKRMRVILEDPEASDYLLVQTIKLLQQEDRIERRAEEAQAWREYVHHDKKAERVEKANQDREEHTKLINASHRVDGMFDFLEAQKKATLDRIRADVAAEKAAKAAKTGQSGQRPPANSGASADKSGQIRTAPTVLPVQPFRYPRPEKTTEKADKSGQA